MTQRRSQILMLHTGGTLGMRPREPDQALAPDEIGSTILEHVPELCEIADVETKVLFNLDSSDIGARHWMELSAEVARGLATHDGIVITHGTDTMAYTAAALSFRLRNLNKPVILTGSQRPLADVRTDGRANLIGAVDLSTREFPEVGIYFDGLLLRGNRATKSSTFAFNAFSSPHHPPLAELGSGFRQLSPPLAPEGAFRLQGRFEERVAAVRILPGGLGIADVERLASSDLKGLVVEAFGSGNLPSEELGPARALEVLTQRGVVVLICSQAAGGEVNLDRYAGGRLARRLGATGTANMTVEAASVKLMYLLGTCEDADAARSKIGEPIAGELG